jgi:23S rRNA (pseudouridine1915-N3)-methyltransferase
MLNIRIICVGKLKERFYTDAAAEYYKRLCGYCKAEIVELAEYRLPEHPSDALISSALEKESELIDKALLPAAKMITMCVEGSEMSSQELANQLMNYAKSGTSKLNFIIGGSFGLHEKLKKRADMMFSMSKMTFPHTLARVMLLEQLYRSFKIAEGGKYHK